MLSEPFQSAIPEGNWMYPAKRAGGRPAGVVRKGSASRRKSLYADPAEVEENRRAWVDEWLAAMSRVSRP